MNKEMPRYTPEDVEKFKEQLKKKRRRKMVGEMTKEEITSRKKEIETDLEKEVDPVIVERIKRRSVDARAERESKEELPILKTTEKKELSPKEKKTRLEKLKEYLGDLENGEAYPIVANIETEKESVSREIEKLEKELEEKN